jgi:hypothetical protein
MKLTRSHLRVVFGLAGLAFLVLAFADSLEQARGLSLPGLRPLAVAFALLLVALFCAGISWVALFEPHHDRATLFAVFFQSQPGKYIPGGVWQATMQVGLSKSPDLGVGAASIAFVVHSLTQLVAGLSLGSLTALVATDLPLPSRVVLTTGLLSLLLLRREWLMTVLGILRRFPGVSLESTDVPAQRSILISTAWSMVVLIGSGAAFAIIARNFGITAGVASLVFTFSASWAIGFLAVTFPAGVGVREGVMLLLLGANAAAVIAASLVHRLLTMAAEVVLLAGVEVRARWN